MRAATSVVNNAIPDTREIEKVRKEIEEEFGFRPRLDLTDTGIDRPVASKGHKGRGGKPAE